MVQTQPVTIFCGICVTIFFGTSIKKSLFFYLFYKMIFITKSILQHKLIVLRRVTQSDNVARLIWKHIHQITANMNNTNVPKDVLNSFVDELETAHLAALLGSNDVVMLQLEVAESILRV